MNSRTPRTMYACALAGALATAACGATRATTPATAPPPGPAQVGSSERAGSLTLSFDQMIVRGHELPMRAMATQVFQSGGIREEAGTIGAGAGIGGIVGGILGGVQGAVLGAVIGAGGAVVATEGKDVHLPAGSIIRIRFDTAVDVG